MDGSTEDVDLVVTYGRIETLDNQWVLATIPESLSAAHVQCGACASNFLGSLWLLYEVRVIVSIFKWREKIRGFYFW
jgi:hypothetical protein